MGLHIFYPSGEIVVLQPFAKRELSHNTVQLSCNVQIHEHRLVFGKPFNHNKKRVPGEFVIEFSVPVFRSITLTGTDALKEFVKRIRTGRAQALTQNSLPLTASMHQCIYHITHYAGKAETKSLFLFARVIDLLQMQQESYMQSTSPATKYVKSEYDKERIIYARDYLLTHMDAPPSLPQLAAIAGINEFKLKRGFREMYNQSVFGYLADIRLEMARTALLRKQKTVTQIAFELGYASLQHFSGAFKKKFGVSPGKYN
jgi:AraC-like DNA-binding protein